MDSEKQMRRERAGFADQVNVDRLPPHDEAAEAGVLGCILLEPVSGLEVCLKRLKAGRVVFYDLRHQEIFAAMMQIADGKNGTDGSDGIDVITLAARLELNKRLEEVGGRAYLAGLPDLVPSAANLSYYLELVLEKYFLRVTLQTCGRVTERIMEHEGAVGPLLDAVESDLASIAREQRGSLGEEMAPKYLRPAGDFAEGAFGHFFRSVEAGEPGLELPIKFPLRIRRGESTLVSADDGAGKSTLLSEFALHLANQERGVCIASFEESPESSLWRLGSQLIGRKRLPETDAGRKEASGAMGWLHSRFWFYDFLGISDWRDVLEAFRYAAVHHGVWLFVLDSVMRIGIPDDDYATQGVAASAFAKFAQEQNAHLVYVIHQNKSDAKGKALVRGSKLWTANAHNVLQVERNMEKGEKLSKLEWKIQGERWQPVADQDHEAIRKMEAECVPLRREWDTHLVLRKQRYPGSQQNASKRFWFDRESFQFRDRWEDTATNWLAAWAGKKTGTNGTDRTDGML